MSTPTMDRINHWRTRIAEAEHALLAAYRELPIGTKIAYSTASGEHVVEIVRHLEPQLLRCRVRDATANPAAQEYNLLYHLIERIVA